MLGFNALGLDPIGFTQNPAYIEPNIPDGGDPPAQPGGAPAYGDEKRRKRRYVIRKGDRLLVFTDPELAKQALHADDDDDEVEKHYPAQKKSLKH
jgi:hypothetical protein